MTSKHCFTPGPWAVFNSEQIAPANALPGDRAVAIIAIRDDQDEQKANANVLAAAPELLEAVERLLYVMTPECDDLFDYNGALGAGQAAVAKAKGEERA